MTASVLARHGERIAIGAIDMVGPEPPGTDADRGRRQGTPTGDADRACDPHEAALGEGCRAVHPGIGTLHRFP